MYVAWYWRVAGRETAAPTGVASTKVWRLQRVVNGFLVLAFVMSRLIYSNSPLYGCPKYLINRLHKVQNIAARLILKVPKTDHITPHLQNSTLASSRCMNSVQNLLSMLQCYQLLWTSVPCWPTEDLCTFSPTPLFCWHLYIVHSFGTHKKLRPTCLFTLCTYSLEKLSKAIRNSESALSFKSALKT